MTKRKLRYKIIFGFALLLLGVLIVQYASLMVFGDTAGRPSRAGATEIERGPILDRNGRILAIETELDTVTAWTPSIEEPEETATILANVLGLDADELLTRFRSNNGFIFVQRSVSPSQSQRLREELAAGRLEGIDLRPDSGRTYPEQQAAAHAVGYVGTENTGLAGVEYTFNSVLSPRPNTEGITTVYGNQVFLTIDVGIQHFTDELANRTLEEHDADSVMILVMNARSGEILSYSSIPAFNPNTFGRAAEDARRNRPVGMLYEPGSVFKIFSLSSFLELGGVDTDDVFVTNGRYLPEEWGDAAPIDDLANYGAVSPREIIQYSSNVGAAYASERVSAEAFYTMLRRFGFGSPTGVDLNGEQSGILTEPGRWSARSKPTLAIGQEIGVTAVQVASAATAFANDGVRLKPLIVRRVVSPEGQVLQDYGRTPVAEVLSARTAREMLEMMHAATQPGGTATRAQVEGIRVSAKTGTAEVYDRELGSYSSEDFIASVLAIIPTDNPELIAYVVIEHPRGESFYGGRIAAPVVGELGDFLVDYLGIPREGDTIASSGRVTVRVPRLPDFEDELPDLRGLPKRVLLPLFARDDIELTMLGEGYVVAQEPPPGTPLSPNMRIRLELD